MPPPQTKQKYHSLGFELGVFAAERFECHVAHCGWSPRYDVPPSVELVDLVLGGGGIEGYKGKNIPLQTPNSNLQ